MCLVLTWQLLVQELFRHAQPVTVTQFDTSSVKIGPVVFDIGKVGGMQDYSLTCQELIG